MLQNKFAKKPVIAQANIKALTDGYNYGNNIHASVSTYRIESKKAEPGFYTDVNGNKATSYGLIAAAEKAGLQLFLGSYPITPATDILHELSKRKDLGVITVQAEDEIAGICTSIGASFAGCLAATSTSGPGLEERGDRFGCNRRVAFGDYRCSAWRSFYGLADEERANGLDAGSVWP